MTRRAAALVVACVAAGLVVSGCTTASAPAAAPSSGTGVASAAPPDVDPTVLPTVDRGDVPMRLADGLAPPTNRWFDVRGHDGARVVGADGDLLGDDRRLRGRDLAHAAVEDQGPGGAEREHHDDADGQLQAGGPGHAAPPATTARCSRTAVRRNPPRITVLVTFQATERFSRRSSR